MRRLVVLAVVMLTLSTFLYGQTSDPPKTPDGPRHVTRDGAGGSVDQGAQMWFERGLQLGIGGSDVFRIGDTFFGGSMWMRWPDKRVTLDVKNASIPEIAKTLQEQTGIEFIIGEGVPSDLKITIHVSDMRAREFLDTLTSTTGLIYVPESRTPEEGIDSKKEDTGGKPTLDDSSIVLKTPSGGLIVTTGRPQPQPVTHVTILNPRTEGIVVNMGKVSVSLKNADPIDAVTKLINQIKGANYVVMSLSDYLALQSPDDEAKIEKALKKASRPKITLELRSIEVADALTQLSSSGRFYLTIPKPGSPSFLIIPDVVVSDESALPSPPISYWSTPARGAREQAICMQYTAEIVDAILRYAKENGGVLADAREWIQLIPVSNEYLEKRMPGGRYQYSYGMNLNLSGMKLSAIKKPSQVVLLFESDVTRGYGTENDVIRSPRHPGGMVYGFADGSVRILIEKPNFKP